MRILVFGDSIGQGAWDVDGGGWVERLRRMYDKRLLESDFTVPGLTVFNLSISGDTSNEVLARIDSEARARTWRGEEFLIIIAIGTNDTRLDGDIAFSDRDRYAENLETIITKAKQLTDKIIVVGIPACDEEHTTPVAWRDVSYTNARLEQFEQTASSVATAQEVAFVPVFNSFRLRAAEGENLFEDGLHPNAAGHQLMYEQVKPVIDALAEQSA